MSDKIYVKIITDKKDFPEYKVIDIDSGKEISNIRSVKITMNPDEIVTAEITLFPAHVEANALAEIKKDS